MKLYIEENFQKTKSSNNNIYRNKKGILPCKKLNVNSTGIYSTPFETSNGENEKKKCITEDSK